MAVRPAKSSSESPIPASSSQATLADDFHSAEGSLAPKTSSDGPRIDAKRRDDSDDDDEDDLVVTGADEPVDRQDGYAHIRTGDASAMADGPARHQDEAARKKAIVRGIGINLLLIASWFFFSTLMNVYNSWLFSDKRKKFSYPLFVTSIHMLVQFGFSVTTMHLCRRNKLIVPRRKNGTRARPSGHDWLSKVVPCALATALDIGLSNLSLKTITLTFYTMCKSSNLAFVLIFAFIFGLEKLKLSLIGIIAVITIGVVMMVAAETEFVLIGAVQVLTASGMGGLRWALMQILLCRKSMGMDNPIATMFWLSPLMAGFMLLGSAVIEDWGAMFSSDFFTDPGKIVETIGFMILPGFIVICMTLSEFALIMRTSVMTLSVAGIFKEILTILLSIAIFGDELTPINVTGLCIALSGIAMYNYLKWRTLVSKSDEDSSEVRFRPFRRRRGRFGTNRFIDDDEDWSDDEREETRMLNGHAGSHGGGYNELDGRPTAMSTIFDSSAALKETGATSSTPDRLLPSPQDSERQREAEKAADMPGWDTSGTQRTGNGLYDPVLGDDDEEEEEIHRRRP